MFRATQTYCNVEDWRRNNALQRKGGENERNSTEKYTCPELIRVLTTKVKKLIPFNFNIGE